MNGGSPGIHGPPVPPQMKGKGKAIPKPATSKSLCVFCLEIELSYGSNHKASHDTLF